MPNLASLLVSIPLLFSGIGALTAMRPAATQEPSQADLMETLKELSIANDYLRAKAEEKITKLGARMLPVIRKELSGREVLAKRRAAKAAFLIGAAAEPLTDLLIAQLEIPDQELRGHALACLGGIGAPARRALKALVRLEPPQSLEIERLLMIVRSRLLEDPASLWETYKKATHNRDARMRYAGLALAFQWCQGQKDLVPQMLRLTRDADREVRRHARELIVGLKDRGRSEIDALAHGDNPLKSVHAMMLLGHFDLTDTQLAFLLAEIEKQPRNQAAREGLRLRRMLARSLRSP